MLKRVGPQICPQFTVDGFCHRRLTVKQKAACGVRRSRWQRRSVHQHLAGVLGGQWHTATSLDLIGKGLLTRVQFLRGLDIP